MCWLNNWKILNETIQFCLCFTSFMIRTKLLVKALLSIYLTCLPIFIWCLSFTSTLPFSFPQNTETFSLEIIEQQRKLATSPSQFHCPPHFFSVHLLTSISSHTNSLFLKNKWDTCYLLLNHILLLAVPWIAHAVSPLCV